MYEPAERIDPRLSGTRHAEHGVPLVSVALLLACTLTCVSHGDQTNSVDTFTNVQIGTTGLNLGVDQFDPANGALTAVEVELHATTAGNTIAWDNEAGAPSDVTIGIGGEVTAGLPSVSVTLVAIPLQTGSGSVDADNDGAADFVGTDAFAVTSGTGEDTDTDNPASPFTGFVGTGQIAVSLDTGTETYLSTTGGYGPIDPNSGTVSGTITVTYTFDPPTAAVPTLSEWGIIVLVVALAGMAFLQTRRSPIITS